MPTPFTHLAFAQRALHDLTLTGSHREAVELSRSAFLLGSIAADARVGAGAPRSHTHFYVYDQPMEDHPWRVMLKRNPALWSPHDAAHRAFIAGYVAHLAMDEYWSLNMVRPHFIQREWATGRWRLLMLHVILIFMDERDYHQREGWQAETLHTAQPNAWLEFLSDDDLRLWRDLIHAQITPHGISQTYEIFGQRVGMPADELRALMDTDAKLHENLWQYVSQETLAEIEQGMYHFALEQMRAYLDESALR